MAWKASITQLIPLPSPEFTQTHFHKESTESGRPVPILIKIVLFFSIIVIVTLGDCLAPVSPTLEWPGGEVGHEVEGENFIFVFFNFCFYL